MRRDGEMIDEVRNPWRKRNGVVVFDVETDWSADWSTRGKLERTFKCGVAYVYNKKKYLEFSEPEKLVQLLKRAKTLVSFNGEGFDFLVLKKHGLKIRKYRNRWKPQRIESLDIMHGIAEYRPRRNRGKKYPSLEEMMFQHYGVKKSEYNPDNLREIRKHCCEDVEYTKRLYEESTWQVPIKKRSILKRRWEHYYDDDMSGGVWDGENWTYIRDFGMPIKSHISAESTMLCPGCKAKRLSLRRVAQGKDSEVVCPQCGTVITFSPANEIISIQSKKEYESSVCKNCGKRIEASGYTHFGYGADYGYLRSGRSICPACGKGCFEWSDDETPGFREHWKGSCCKCNRDIGKWRR
jgi:hypothetical protein